MRLVPFQLFCVLGVCFQATLGMSRISTFDRKMALVQSREDFITDAPFKCPGSGSYPVPGQECTGVYYSCATGSPVLTTCNGANSVFDPTTGSCMSASIAPCKNPPTTSSSTHELSTTEETTEPIETTTARQTKETTSPTTTTEKTTERTTSTSPTTPPTTTESTTERKTSTSTTTSPSTSESTTEKTTRTTSTTTPPTITESTTERKTSTSTTRSSTVPSGTTPIPFTCSADGSYPNPSNCNTFYMCSNGTPYIYNCPSNLVYNPLLQYCDYKANVPSCNNA